MKQFIMDGFVTKNVDIRGTNSGRMVTKFSINSPTYNRETNTNTPQFFDCEYWWNGPQDRKAKNITEGALLLVSGQLKQDTWQDKTTGNNRSKITLTVREIGVIAPPKNTIRQPNTAPQPGAQPMTQPAPQAAPVQPMAAQPVPQRMTAPQRAPQPATQPAPQPVAQQTAMGSIYDVDIPF